MLKGTRSTEKGTNTLRLIIGATAAVGIAAFKNVKTEVKRLVAVELQSVADRQLRPIEHHRHGIGSQKWNISCS